jgi:hypothetical protein
MQEIITDDKFNHNKAAAFNSTVRQANTIIESCKDLIPPNAEETIDELMQNISTIKLASRLFRFVGFGVTCYGLYHIMSPSKSTMDSLASYIPPTGPTLIQELVRKLGRQFTYIPFSCPTSIREPMRKLDLKSVGFAAACSVASYAWLSLSPTRAYAFQDDLVKQKRLTCTLRYHRRDLETTLKTASDIVHAHQRSSFVHRSSIPCCF